jgi:tripartite-type tricarboxylate transporter receptor subunit TctC
MAVRAAVLATLVLSCAPVHAQTAAGYPVRPVRFLIPFAVGGTNDIVGRILAQKLTERFGQQFVVDNRGGAGGTLAAEVVARSAPDGYTILQGNPGPSAIAASLYPKLAYHPVKDFSPVTLVARAPMLLVVHPSVPARTLKELIVYGRTPGSRINYASSSLGSVNHLAMELLKHAAGINAVHIPYKGTGPAMADLLAGQVQTTIAAIPPVQQHLASGRLRALASSGSQRTPLLPEIPTIAENGYPDVEAYTWTGLLLPAGTPAAIVNRLHDETARIVREPDVRERFAAQGVEPVGNTPREFATYLEAETNRWARAVRQAGVRAE